MSMEHLRLLTPDCAGKNCPRVFRSDSGSLVVQGLRVSPELRAQLDPEQNEEVVELPGHLVDDLVRALTAS
jgi:hypothetical protein